MNKGHTVRQILQRSEWMLRDDIAREAGCARERVSQIFRELKAEGEIVDWRPSASGGRREEFRLLVGQEAADRKRDRKRRDAERAMRVEVRQVAADLRAHAAAALRIAERLERFAA